MAQLESVHMLGPAFPPAWLRYRDAFAVLQYLCALSACEPGIPVPWQKVVTELGFTDHQGSELLAFLLSVDCIDYHQGYREAALTPKALQYLEWERGRRRSIRPLDTAAGDPVRVPRATSAAGSGLAVRS